MVIVDKLQWARAFASSFMADMARHPDIAGTPAELRAMILRDLAADVRGEPVSARFSNLRAFLRTQMNIKEDRLRGGMGQWADILNTITEATGSYFTTKEKAKTQEKLAELKIKAQQLTLAQQEAEAARERRAMAAAEGSPLASAQQAPGGGVPTWALAIAGVVTVGAVTKVAGVW